MTHNLKINVLGPALAVPTFTGGAFVVPKEASYHGNSDRFIYEFWNNKEILSCKFYDTTLT